MYSFQHQQLCSVCLKDNAQQREGDGAYKSLRKRKSHVLRCQQANKNVCVCVCIRMRMVCVYLLYLTLTPRVTQVPISVNLCKCRTAVIRECTTQAIKCGSVCEKKRKTQ